MPINERCMMLITAPKPPASRRWITVKEAHQQLEEAGMCIHVATMYSMISDGSIKSKRLRRKLFVSAEAIEAMISE